MSFNLRVRPGKDRVLSIFIKNLIPSIFGLLALTTAWIIDGIFVGRYVGPHGIAAINLSYPIVSFSFGISVMIAMGGSTLAAAAKGGKKRKQGDRYFSATILIIALFSFAFSASGLVFKNQLIDLLGADSFLDSYVSEYLTIIFYFIFPLVITYTFDAFIRNSGAPGFSLITLISGSVLNIILDWLFVTRMGFGLTGAAYATGISQLITAIVQLFFFFSKASFFRFTRPLIPLKSVLKIIYNGSSEFINEMSAGITAYMFNITLMKKIGSEGVSAFSIFNYIMLIALMIFFASAQSIQPEINYCYGAGKKDRIRKMFILGLGFNFIAGIFFFTIVYLKADTIAHIFTGKVSSLDNLVTDIARYFSIAFLISGLNITVSAYFTSIQKAGESALIASSRGLVFVVINLLILPLFLGNTGIWLTVPAAELLTLIISVYLVFRHKSLKSN
jgi:MATE family, multidrug efflux pump